MAVRYMTIRLDLDEQNKTKQFDIFQYAKENNIIIQDPTPTVQYDNNQIVLIYTYLEEADTRSWKVKKE